MRWPRQCLTERCALLATLSWDVWPPGVENDNCRCVRDDQRAIAPNATSWNRAIAAAQASENLRLLCSGDHPKDTPRSVQGRQGERHAPPSLIWNRHGDVGLDNVERGVARNKGG